MKIGINARFLTQPYTGIGTYTKNLLEALAQIDRKNEYLCLVPAPASLKLRKNFKIIVLPEKKFGPLSFRKTWWEQVQVPRFFQKRKIDLAHFFYPSNPRFFFKKIPVVVTVHDVIPWTLSEYRRKFKTKIYHWNAKKALAKTDLIVTVSLSTKQALLKISEVPSSKIRVIFNAASPFFQKRPSLEEVQKIRAKYHLSRPFFLYVGGYDSRKNVVRLVQAYLEYLASRFKIDLVLVGGKVLGDKLYHGFEILTGKREKGIIKTGFVPEEELNVLYRESLALCNFSLSEGFNIPLIEAAVTGTPIITSNLPVHREILRKNALFSSPLKISSIGRSLEKFLMEPNLRKKLKHRSLKIASRFSWKKGAKELLNFYQKLASSK